MCETLSVPNFHGAGNSSFDAFEKSKPLSQSDFRTTRTTSPKYFPLMYFSNLLCERNISLWEKHFYEISRVGEVFCHGNERWWCYFFIMSFAIKKNRFNTPTNWMTCLAKFLERRRKSGLQIAVAMMTTSSDEYHRSSAPSWVTMKSNFELRTRNVRSSMSSFWAIRRRLWVMSQVMEAFYTKIFLMKGRTDDLSL